MPEVRTPSQINRIFRFGDFEFSVRAGELRKNGEVIRLQYQPLRVLLALLEHSGEAVTRDEIRERLWPEDSVQDFDNSLRVAIAKLRQAFGDDADSPRYIETLPRRGYRWIYPISVHDAKPNLVGPAHHSVRATNSMALRDGYVPPKPSPLIASEPSRRTILGRRILVSLSLWLAVMAAVWFLRPQQPVPEPSVSPLTTYPGLEYMPALSPDGKRVAFAWTGPNATDPYRVYVKKIGEDYAQPVTDTPSGACDSNPVWTPDGRFILFFRRFGNESGIYRVAELGGAAQLLKTMSLHGGPVRRGRFAVSPSGNALAYPDIVPGQQQIALFLFDMKTLQSRQLTFPPPTAQGDSDPAFSRNGKAVAFERDTLDLEQVHLVPTIGGSERPLTNDKYSDISGLAWTLDNRQLLLGGRQLRKISTSEGGQTPAALPNLSGPVLYPDLRGNRLAYSQAWDNANIWKLDLRYPTEADGVPTKLISSTRQQAAASFSPDGSQIAFQSDRSGSWEIWKANRDGSNAVQLTRFHGALTGTPRWSPNGRQIAFDSRDSGNSEIYAIASDGGTPRQATASSSGGMVPAWSHDGRWIYYSSQRNGVTNIWKTPATGGAERQVTTKGGIYAAESSDGKYLYYSRSQGDPTLWRVALNGSGEQSLIGAPKPFGCSHWALAASGIYIVDQNGDLNYYDFDRRNATKVMHHPEFLTDWSLAVSPDGHEIVWAQVDSRSSDLMLVDNFR